MRIDAASENSLKESAIKEFNIDLDEVDSLVRRALAATYVGRDRFSNESDFKFELYHQLHGLELNGHRLGDRLPGFQTCPLHAEAKPENGNPSKADLLICNPTINNGFNYRAEVLIELKTDLGEKDLRVELKKLQGYTDGSVRRLYVIPANRNKLSKVEETRVLSEYRKEARRLYILDRSAIAEAVSSPQNVKPAAPRQSLLDRTTQCIRETLNLYGKYRQQYHSFFWCNYEHGQGKGWTFPVEGDFNAQLYHRLRTRLPRKASIQTEYSPAARLRADFFIKSATESVGIEVKMNWDQFKPKYKDGVETEKEARAILEKFDAMSAVYSGHSNILVVIQGEEAYQAANKSGAIQELGRGSPFRLFYYDEKDGSPVGRKSL